MSTHHDLLAYATAMSVVRDVVAGNAPWNGILTTTAYVTSSRAWPVPDFVIVDSDKKTLAAEFKPPMQTKREYLTGLGQAIAYTRDFDYGLLVVPQVADDGYRIADHISRVLQEAPWANAPVGLISYDPATFSPTAAAYNIERFFATRTAGPSMRASLDASYFAKWREMSLDEMFRLLEYSYEEKRRPSSATGTIRDRAFGRLWSDIQAGRVMNPADAVRNYANTTKNYTGVGKNYRNFLNHIGWTESDGSLTHDGLEAWKVGTQFGHNSQPFRDAVARSLLLDGKHLVLFNAIDEFQASLRVIPDQGDWLEAVEEDLDRRGILKRNRERAAAATAGEQRGFLKAEKQLWRMLGLIRPRGGRVYHDGRGFIFNWARITDLIR